MTEPQFKKARNDDGTDDQVEEQSSSSANAASIAHMPIVGNVRQHLLGDFNPTESKSWPAPEKPATTKAWQSDVTNELRHHLVGKIVKAIFPSPDPAAMHPRIKDLIVYARRKEREFYETANDREEYYDLLAEDIFKIGKELQARKEKRLSESRGTQGGSSVQSEISTLMEGMEVAGASTDRDSLSRAERAEKDRDEIAAQYAELEKKYREAITKLPASSSLSEPAIAHPLTSASATTPTPAGSKCVFEQADMRKHLEPVLNQLDMSDDAVPFKVPVDPHALNIPDYLDIVKRPMDLSTISEKLRSGRYTNPWQFCDDMWLMFENAWLYNKKNSKVYKYCTNLSKLFIHLIDPVMRSMGYCCGQKLSFTREPIFCYGASMCTIGIDQAYFCYETTSTTYGVIVSERYTYCPKCYESLPEEGISLTGNTNDRSSMVPKNAFNLFKNNVVVPEPFTNCKNCYRKVHKICELYDEKVFPDGFVCATCRREKKMPLPENKYLASKLPTSQLSNHLEDRVDQFIQRRTQEGSECNKVIIRVLSSTEKEVEVNPMMRTKYCGDAHAAFPERFPYKSKGIFAFEEIDGVEVCIFGMYVQEYGSECPSPNQRRVYLSSIDSVHYFKPAALRTDVYHEILLGYLDYAGKLGYTMAHIWTHPPSDGEDLIFHCHPADQKIPKPKRLHDWFMTMLNKGIQEGCVVEYKDIYQQAKDDNLTSPARLPYFDGDFWPNVIEDCIKEASETGEPVTEKLYAQLETHKETFLSIRLVAHQSADMEDMEIVIADPDPLTTSDLMDGRESFLIGCREEHWEFSSLRRAKYSTLCLARALHVEEGKDMEYTCNQCQSTKAHWHCPQCEDFDLCDSCKATVGHPHQLEKVKALLEGEGANTRYESIQSCLHSLVHACTCRDANCRRMSCHKMKRVVAHTKVCKKRVNASCPVCKQLIALCCYHAKFCFKDRCQVPFCMNIRQRLLEQKRSLSRRADLLMRRRIEAVAHASDDTSTSSSPSMSMNILNAELAVQSDFSTAAEAAASLMALPRNSQQLQAEPMEQDQPGPSNASSLALPRTEPKTDNEKWLEALEKLASGQERTNELLEKILRKVGE